MDLIKQYIVQSIAAASNNLRLTSYQLNVVGLLRETILNSEDITDDFKKHSQYLIKDLNHLLETDSTNELKNTLRELKHTDVMQNEQGNEINVDLSEIKTDSNQLIVNDEEERTVTESDKNVEEEQIEDEPLITERVKNFEELILKPIKPIDNLLNRLTSEEVSYEDLSRFAELMKENGEISERGGFEILANMHKIISASFLLIKSRELMPGKDVIESIRSCLIVIVAVVRGKDVDITKYLNKAEDFGREINALNNMKGF